MYVLSSEHFCTFTGAGISTAAGIPDFRSGANTVLATGAGAWEKAAAIQKARKAGTLKNEPAAKGGVKVGIAKAYPTKCHMAMVALMEAGLLKHAISQNCDGLHRRSGIPAEKLTEVHGNTNLEVCIKCGKEYMRDFRVRTAKHVHEHKTGRKCDDSRCGGDLKDTIINFNENLDPVILERGELNGQSADLMLAMGSSLRIYPAAGMAKATAEQGGKLVIVNLQKTPLDAYADMVIHGKTDEVMEMLMKELNMVIPQWKQSRWVKCAIDTTKSGKETLTVGGIDGNGCAYDLFKGVSINGKAMKTATLSESQMKAGQTIPVKLQFQGHYGETDLTLNVPRDAMKASKSFLKINIIWSPYTKSWETAIAYDAFTNQPLGPVQMGEGVKMVQPKAAALNKQMAGMKI